MSNLRWLVVLLTPILWVGADDDDVPPRHPPRPSLVLPNLRPDRDVLGSGLQVDDTNAPTPQLEYALGGANYGPGHYMMIGIRQNSDLVMPAHQLVYLSNGLITMLPGPAGQFVYSNEEHHHHWHYEDWFKVVLTKVSNADKRSALKQSFCLRDSARVHDPEPRPWLLPENIPDQVTIRGTTYKVSCGSSDPAATYVAQGVSSGWMDIYDTFYNEPVAFPSSDTTGTYKLTAVINPNRTIQEVTEEDNVESIYFKVEGGLVTVIDKP